VERHFFKKEERGKKNHFDLKSLAVMEENQFPQRHCPGKLCWRKAPSTGGEAIT
jgi:hypothetical protein